MSRQSQRYTDDLMPLALSLLQAIARSAPMRGDQERAAAARRVLLGTTILCRSCGDLFGLDADERAWYLEQGLLTPRHCPSCRAARREREAEHPAQTRRRCAACGKRHNPEPQWEGDPA
jgi:hypothetical protein